MKKVMFILLIMMACQDDDPKTKFQIDAKYTKFVDSFYSEAQTYGWSLKRDNLIMADLKTSEVQAIWETGRSTKTGDQWTIKILVDLVPAQREIPVYREMAHVLLNKPYTTDPTDMMNQTFSPAVWTSEPGFEIVRRQYLDKLFKK